MKSIHIVKTYEGRLLAYQVPVFRETSGMLYFEKGLPECHISQLRKADFGKNEAFSPGYGRAFVGLTKKAAIGALKSDLESKVSDAEKAVKFYQRDLNLVKNVYGES